MKDIIITAGGKNVTPSEWENELKFSPYVTDAVVIGEARPVDRDGGLGEPVEVDQQLHRVGELTGRRVVAVRIRALGAGHLVDQGSSLAEPPATGDDAGRREGVDVPLVAVRCRPQHLVTGAALEQQPHRVAFVAERGLDADEHVAEALAEHEILEPALRGDHAMLGGVEVAHAAFPALFLDVLAQP